MVFHLMPQSLYIREVYNKLWWCKSFIICFQCVKSVQTQSYFWSVFSCIWTECRKIRTRNNSVFGHFSRSVQIIFRVICLKKIIFCISQIVSYCFLYLSRLFMILISNQLYFLDLLSRIACHMKYILETPCRLFSQSPLALSVTKVLRFEFIGFYALIYLPKDLQTKSPEAVL